MAEWVGGWVMKGCSVPHAHHHITHAHCERLVATLIKCSPDQCLTTRSSTIQPTNYRLNMLRYCITRIRVFSATCALGTLRRRRIHLHRDIGAQCKPDDALLRLQNRAKGLQVCTAGMSFLPAHRHERMFAQGTYYFLTPFDILDAMRHAFILPESHPGQVPGFCGRLAH
jgi:hypothetical protein